MALVVSGTSLVLAIVMTDLHWELVPAMDNVITVSFHPVSILGTTS